MRLIHVFIILIVVLAYLGAVGAVVLFVLRGSQEQTVLMLPTRAVLPSLTPSDTLTRTQTPSKTATATPTLTSTPTHTATATATSTQTPTLATRIIQISAVMPGVYVPPTTTPFPEGTILLPAPPQPIEPLPDATNESPPYWGWYSFESDHPLVQYSTPWQARQILQASEGQYHRSENVPSTVTFAFEGVGQHLLILDIETGAIVDVTTGISSSMFWVAESYE